MGDAAAAAPHQDADAREQHALRPGEPVGNRHQGSERSHTLTHHGHGLTSAGEKFFDKPLSNSEPKLRAVFEELAAKFGTVLVVVDRPASIGALPLTVARDVGCQVAYLPGLAMRRIADLYPGEAKTTAKDVAVIADAARTMPHTLRSLERTDEITAELTVLVGIDEDLAAEATRTSNRIRGLLTQLHPAWSASSAPASTTRPSPGCLNATAPGCPAESWPPQTRRADPPQGPAHGHPAHRRRLRRPQSQ